MQVLSTLALLPAFALGAVLPAALQSGTKVAKRDSWGGSVSLGPTKSDIINAVTTLIPGTAPATQNGELFLWPGMSNGTGDLIQTTMESWPSNAWCGATMGQWCVRASIFGSFGQLDGTGSAVSGDDHVRIEYNLLSDDNTWVQTVTNALTGAALSNYSYASGPYMTGYGTGTECDSDCTGTVAAQVYLNTTITLREADTTFGDTIATGAGATYTGLSSSEGGKVWTIATINIPAMGSETAVASSTSAATAHSTPVETAVAVVDESNTVATSVATSDASASASAAFGDDVNAAPSASPSGQRSGHGLGGVPKPSESVGAAPSGAFGQGFGSDSRPSGAAPSGAAPSGAAPSGQHTKHHGHEGHHTKHHGHQGSGHGRGGHSKTASQPAAAPAATSAGAAPSGFVSNQSGKSPKAESGKQGNF